MNIFYVLHAIFSGFNEAFLDAIALLSILLGIFIIISKNPIVSVLFLILLFSSISCYLIFIGIKFIGISYLLVYVGAVSILFLFILMLINIRVSELIGDTNNNIPLAILAIIGFFLPFSTVVPNMDHIKSISLLSNINWVVESKVVDSDTNLIYVTSKNWDGNLVDTTDIISIGNIMYTSYSIWLLITSIILLLAMVGSIVITIKQRN